MCREEIALRIGDFPGNWVSGDWWLGCDGEFAVCVRVHIQFQRSQNGMFYVLTPVYEVNHAHPTQYIGKYLYCG